MRPGVSAGFSAMVAVGALLTATAAGAQEPPTLDEGDRAECAEVPPKALEVLERGAPPEEGRNQLLSKAAGCAVMAGRLEEAYRMLKAADAGPDDPMPAAVMLMFMAALTDSDETQVRALEVLASDPEGLRSVSFDAIVTYTDSLRARARPLHRRALLALRRGGFGAAGPFSPVSAMARDLAVYAADAGDAEDVGLSLSRIEDPDILLQVRLDGRFAVHVAADPERYEPRAAAERRLGAVRSAASAGEDDPRRTGWLRDNGMPLATKLFDAAMAAEAARQLSRLGRGEEALTLLDGAQREDPGPLAAPRFRPRLQAARGRVLWDLGRLRDAEASFADIEPDLEEAWDTDYGAMAVRLGHPKEALEALGAPGPGFSLRSPARGVVARRVAQRACALAASGDQPGLAEALVTLTEYARDTPAQAEALLCAGDHAAARDSYLRRLADPLLAGEALAALSTYQTPPRPTPHEAKMEIRLNAIRRDPAVAAAIAAAGRIETVPLLIAFDRPF